ncbi:MAG TPA: PhnD/SsuA/transferrin family substrate-binding protein [Burkholderiales bacterium]|nr:PhnD/SsuA/transferrin family substrate-binding protein [Burkholderiales bacterium]
MKFPVNLIRNGALALTLVAAAEVCAQTPRLTMGVYPGVESGQESFEVMDRYLPLARYLSSKIGMQVLLVPVRVPGAAMRNMIQGDTSYQLFFGPPIFASQAIHKAGFVPIVVEEERIRGVFVAKQASKLESLKDFTPATTIVMPSPGLLLTILANETLAQQNIAPAAGKRTYSDTAEGIVLALNNDIAEVAVMRDRTAQKLIASQPPRFKIVGLTADAPGFGLIAHKAVSADVRAKLRRAALALNSDSSALAVEVRAGLRTSPFVAGSSDDFAALQRMMDAAALARGK